MRNIWMVAAGLVVFGSGLHAAEIDRDAVQAMISKTFPGVVADDVGLAVVPGFYEVVVGTRLVYMSTDGKYVLLGDLIDADKRVNLSEARRAELTSTKLAAVPPERMIVIGPENPSRFVNVFTDVDCPYCARFHRDVPKLNEAGVAVHYFLFPRTGVGSKSYERAVGVWCADDPVEMIGIAKAGGEVAPIECDNPVKDHLALGRAVGVQGTPAIFLEDGTMIPGYVPPERLFEQMGHSPR
ncbi:MAG: DsbC family protein [Gammaproteobacteria bacterium]|nr:DsbC family protein [Gammaproteobacteria bacterium]